MTAADVAIAYARAQIGKPYEWGQTGPNGYDCSGLVFKAYQAAGVKIGRTTYQQIFNGKEVGRNNLLPGDLVFPDPGHVQLYTGNGMIVEAAQSGIPIREVKMWGFWRARRVAEPATGSAGPSVEPAVNPATPVNALTDVWNALRGIYNALASVGKAGEWLSHGDNWIRIGTFLLGAMLAWFAINNALGVREKATAVVKGVSSVVGSGNGGK